MKRMKPIEKVKFYGCGNCGTLATQTLDKEEMLESCFVHIVSLNGTKEINGIKVCELEAKENDTLLFMTPLHDETYQLQDGEWILVEQGQGYA